MGEKRETWENDGPHTRPFGDDRTRRNHPHRGDLRQSCEPRPAAEDIGLVGSDRGRNNKTLDLRGIDGNGGTRDPDVDGCTVRALRDVIYETAKR